MKLIGKEAVGFLEKMKKPKRISKVDKELMKQMNRLPKPVKAVKK